MTLETRNRVVVVPNMRTDCPDSCDTCYRDETDTERQERTSVTNSIEALEVGTKFRSRGTDTVYTVTGHTGTRITVSWNGVPNGENSAEVTMSEVSEHMSSGQYEIVPNAPYRPRVGDFVRVLSIPGYREVGMPGEARFRDELEHAGDAYPDDVFRVSRVEDSPDRAYPYTKHTGERLSYMVYVARNSDRGGAFYVEWEQYTGTLPVERVKNPAIGVGDRIEVTEIEPSSVLDSLRTSFAPAAVMGTVERGGESPYVRFNLPNGTTQVWYVVGWLTEEVKTDIPPSYTATGLSELAGLERQKEDMQREIDRLKLEVERTKEDTLRDTLGKLEEEAEERSWCSEYDEFLETHGWSRFNNREREITVTGTFSVTVTVRASQSAADLDRSEVWEKMDSYSLDNWDDSDY